MDGDAPARWAANEEETMLRSHATNANPCGKPLGRRLIMAPNDDGSMGFLSVPSQCEKPANFEGPDGVKRCAQHDRMARGLSGKWTTPSATGN